MASLNKCFIIGHAGRDCEIRYLPSGAAVANVSIATTSRWKDKSSGEMVEETQWHRCQAFERTAEIMGEYVKKGTQVYVEGRLKYGKYADKDGVERHTTDIVVTNLVLLGSPQQGQERAPAQQQRQTPARNEYAEQRGGGQRRPAPSQGQRQAARPSGGSTGFDDMPDDVPW